MSLKLCTNGCGQHSHAFHGPAQRDIAHKRPDLVRLAACCDLDSEKARRYATEFGFARSYTDAAKMIREETPDALCLIVPTQAVCAAAIPLLKLDIPLLMEKPPGLTSAELEVLIAEAARSGCRHLVGFNRRFMPIIAHACDLLKGTTERPFPIGGWQIDYEMIRYNRRDPDFSTTVIHALDAALFLAGSPLRTAEFTYQSIPNQPPEVVAAQINGTCLSGTTIHWTIHPMAGRVCEQISIHASGHSLRLDLPIHSDGTPGQLIHFGQNQLLEQQTYTPPDQIGFHHETEAFLEAIASETELPGPQLADCRQTVALMEAFRDRQSAVTFP